MAATKQLNLGSRSREPKVVDGKTYVWELPVRIFHWVNAICIFILVITGIYIGHPFVSAGVPEEAYYSYLMGYVRNVHFYTAFIFTITLLYRWYWVYKGNKFSRSNPLKKEFMVGVYQTLRYYLFMKNKKKHYVGHNPLAELSYWIFIGLGSVIMVFTGYSLYFEPQPESGFGKLFAFVPYIFGNSYSIRSWHHIVAWFFIIFVVIHVYMAFREDWLSKNGTMSSIFTGYKNDVEHSEGEGHVKKQD